MEDFALFSRQQAETIKKLFSTYESQNMFCTLDRKVEKLKLIEISESAYQIETGKNKIEIGCYIRFCFESISINQVDFANFNNLQLFIARHKALDY